MSKEIIPQGMEIELPREHELIAQAMLETRGDLAKASRFDAVQMNAMALRREVQANPAIRNRYLQLLGMKLQEQGVHIVERISRMFELQNDAYGGMKVMKDPITGEETEMEIPADPKLVIELSKEISRLIAEGESKAMSDKAIKTMYSKEDVKNVLDKFLDS